ncbi:MAG: rhodanese-like domain-containing protein [Pseudomonadota bacterium]
MLKNLFACAAVSFLLIGHPVTAKDVDVEFVTHIAASEMFDDGAQFIDVRGYDVADLGQVQNADNLPFATDYTEESLAMLVDMDQALVFYSDHSSLDDCIQAAKLARQWGYQKVYVMQDGFGSWVKASLPVQ